MRIVAFVYVASLLPRAAADLSNATCVPITLDFITKGNDPQVAAVEDDIAADLAQIGITLNVRRLNASAYREAELSGDFHMLFTRTWGAPYDPHSYMTSWAVPAHVEYSAIGGLEAPLTRDSLLAMISEVQVQSDQQVIADKWEEILSALHQQTCARNMPPRCHAVRSADHNVDTFTAVHSAAARRAACTRRRHLLRRRPRRCHTCTRRPSPLCRCYLTHLHLSLARIYLTALARDLCCTSAVFLPLWGTRVPFALNRRLGGFTPSTQTYVYPLSSVRVLSGSANVTVAPGAGGSLFRSVGPVNPHQYYPNQLFAQAWIYEGLVGYGQDGEILPVLATEWVLEDLPSGGRRYTFTLRQGVKFHDGSDWNCAVAKLNFDHVLSETVKQRHQWYGTPQKLTSWTCSSDGKFVLETSDKYYPLLQELTYIRPLTFAAASAFAQGSASHPDTHNSCNSGDFGSRWSFLEDSITCAGLKPIGTGPFKLAVQETNADGVDIEAVFARHADYWGGAPDIEFMHLKYYESQDAVMSDLVAGNLDMALGIGPLTARQIQTLKRSHSDLVDVRHSDVMQHALMIMNTNAEHTRDIDTRRAIIHAVDKSRFIKDEFAGLEQPVSQMLPWSAPYCNVDLNPKWSYDFQKALLLHCPSPTEKSVPLAVMIGVIAASVAVVLLLICCMCYLVRREKAGSPVFQNLSKPINVTSRTEMAGGASASSVGSP